MTTSCFVISLDFELFWGIRDKHAISSDGRNVLGEWDAIPRMLALFRQHRLRVTWATVGMLMCRNYRQWREIRPPTPPDYANPALSPYYPDRMVRDHDRLFFARPLAYRGNATHWLYRNGDAVAGGLAGRVVRFADACLPLSGARGVHAQQHCGLVNLPASLFLYPCAGISGTFSPVRLWRLKQAMTMAARTGKLFHLWWHPHNFGINLEQNLALLEALLRHYEMLAARYGMQSRCMRDFTAAKIAPSLPGGSLLATPLDAAGRI